MKFTMDGGFSAYDFKDEEEDDADIEKLKALAGAPALSESQASPHIKRCWIWSRVPVVLYAMDPLHLQSSYAAAHGVAAVCQNAFQGLAAASHA